MNKKNHILFFVSLVIYAPVAIFIHELGHVIAAYFCGVESTIHATYMTYKLPPTIIKQIIIASGGIAIDLILFFMIFVAMSLCKKYKYIYCMLSVMASSTLLHWTFNFLYGIIRWVSKHTIKTDELKIAHWLELPVWSLSFILLIFSMFMMSLILKKIIKYGLLKQYLIGTIVMISSAFFWWITHLTLF